MTQSSIAILLRNIATCPNLAFLNISGMLQDSGSEFIDLLADTLHRSSIKYLSVDISGAASLALANLSVVLKEVNMSLVSIKSSRIDWQYAHGDLEQILHALKANEWIASDRSSAYDPALEPIISSKLELLESGVLDEENMLKEAYGTIDKEDDLLSGSAFNESPRMSSGESPPRLSCSDTTNDGIEIFDADLQGTI